MCVLKWPKRFRHCLHPSFDDGRIQLFLQFRITLRYELIAVAGGHHFEEFARNGLATGIEKEADNAAADQPECDDATNDKKQFLHQIVSNLISGQPWFLEKHTSNRERRVVGLPCIDESSELPFNQLTNRISPLRTIASPVSDQEERTPTGRVSQVFTYFGSVRFDDTDANGHVNNARYNAYCDEAAMQIFAAGGMDVSKAGINAIGAITRRAEYDYLGQLRYGDRFRVESTIEFTKPTRIVFRHDVYQTDDNVCVCKCVAFGNWMDFRTGRPHKLGEDQMLKILLGRGKDAANSQ